MRRAHRKRIFSSLPGQAQGPVPTLRYDGDLKTKTSNSKPGSEKCRVDLLLMFTQPLNISVPEIIQRRIISQPECITVEFLQQALAWAGAG